jgi:hypothetical protein
MKNEEIQASIQLDKLVFTCTSTVSDNFDEAVKHYPELTLSPQFSFGNTTLTQTTDMSRRYKYSYTVDFNGKRIGQIDFDQFGCSWRDGIRFKVDNTVFYNNTQCYLPNVLDDLNLKINNFSCIDIAIDSYKFNAEQILRRNLKNKENQVRIMHNIIKDRTATVDYITYFNKGSLNNPFKIRSLSIKDKEATKEYFVYDKLEEIKYSDKGYILDFHIAKNPKLKNIYRAELRVKYKAIYHYWTKVIKEMITLDNLLDKEFLYAMFTYNLNTLISIKDAHKKEIPLYFCPF